MIKSKLAALFVCVAIGFFLFLASGFYIYRDLGLEYTSLSQKDRHSYGATIVDKRPRSIQNVPIGCHVTYRGNADGFAFQSSANKFLCPLVRLGSTVQVYATSSGYVMSPKPIELVLTFFVFIFSGYGIRTAIRRLRNY